MAKPEAEVALTIDVVKNLLDSQFPEYAQWPISFLDSGWDNCLYRLGKTLVVRLPRRRVAAELIRQEQNELPMLAKRLTIPVPVPVHIGQPQNEYPWPWSIVPWFEGAGADVAIPSGNQAIPFADFLIELHRPAPAERAVYKLRGVPLLERDTSFTERLDRLKKTTTHVLSHLESLWQEGLQTSARFEHCWIHGDLHAQNVIVHEEKIAAVIDWGDLTAGDVATDLASAWNIFAQAEERQAIMQRYAPTAELLVRAKAWAAFFAVFLLDSGLQSSPRHARQGQVLMERLRADR